MYKQLDKYLPRLKKKIRQEYNYLSLISFDELNAITTKDKTENLFINLMDFNKKEYLKIIKWSVGYALSVLDDENVRKYKENKIDLYEDFLEYILSSYNNVTCYLYKKEANRKRLRLYEEVMTAKQFLNRDKLNESLRKSANLWFTQSSQYGIEVTDKAVLETFKRAGIKQVKWVTEKDERVCSECKKINGQTFDIDKVPSKVHYNCRCYVVPN